MFIAKLVVFTDAASKLVRFTSKIIMKFLVLITLFCDMVHFTALDLIKKTLFTSNDLQFYVAKGGCRLINMVMDVSLICYEKRVNGGGNKL